MFLASGEEKNKKEEERQWSQAPSVGCILTVHSEIQKAVNSAQNPTQRAAGKTWKCCYEVTFKQELEKAKEDKM